MLIVGREVGQSIIIGDVIKVTVLQISLKLKLVIDAPKNMRITKIKQTSNKIIKLNASDRKIGETVLIGEKIKISIIQTQSGLLRFAIDAPKEVTVLREEIYQKQLENV